jgi:hypothetical protein
MIDLIWNQFPKTYPRALCVCVFKCVLASIELFSIYHLYLLLVAKFNKANTFHCTQYAPPLSTHPSQADQSNNIWSVARDPGRHYCTHLYS